MTTEIIEKGKRIIGVEIEGLTQLKNSISDSFVEACKIILSCKGRVIVTGMGKSGHVGVKIASTLASTGTLSQFVHPAEALHGDLGMISKNDIVLAISNSGRTVELSGIINYCLRFNIPLIAITQNPTSELGSHADILLQLPNVKEACSLGLAPTTSTTNTLALGDALAVTLLELRRFSEDDFKVFHPGGALGTKLIKVTDIMHPKESVPLVVSGSKVGDAIKVMTACKFGCVGVVNSKEELIGIITDGDIRRNLSSDFLEKNVDDIMTINLVTIDENKNTSKVLRMFHERKITAVFVTSGKTPVGIIHIHDLINLGVV